MARRPTRISIGITLTVLGLFTLFHGPFLSGEPPSPVSIALVVLGMFLLSSARASPSGKRGTAHGKRSKAKRGIPIGYYKSGQLSRRQGLAILAILLLAGAAAMGTGGYYLHRDLTAPWEVVEGVVFRSEVLSHRGSDSMMWSSLVEYGYIYQGREYRGAYEPGYSTSDYSEVLRFVEDRPPGSRVEVKVNRDDPSESRLRLGFATENFGWLLALGMGSLVAVPSGWALRRGLRQGTPRPDLPPSAELPDYGTAYAVVECPSCHQLVEPARK